MAKAKYTTRQFIEAMQGTGGIKSVIATRLGCHRNTIENYISRYPTVSRAFDAERQRIIDLAEGKFIEKIKDGEWPAIRLALLTLGKDRGYVERQEIVQTIRDLTIELKWSDAEVEPDTSAAS